MRIWLFSQFFPPEMGAPAARFFDFGRHFVQFGHQLTVFTGFPNFPSGRVQEFYRARIFMRESNNGIAVIRSWFFTAEDSGVGRKGLGYLTYVASATIAAAFQEETPDVILATVPPPTTTIPAQIVSRRHRKPWVMDIRDLWPEALVAGGRIGVGASTFALESVNQFSFRHAAAIVTVSDGKRARLVELGVPRSKIAVIPNGVDLEYWERAQCDNREQAIMLLKHSGVPDQSKVLLYAGVMNPPQGLDIVLAMARDLQNRGVTDIYTVLVGDGQQRQALQRLAADQRLSHVRFLPQQSRETVAGLYGIATAILIPLRPRKDTHTVPSKVFEAMGSGKPILLSATGEAADLVTNAGAGVVVNPGNASAMADAASILCLNSDLATSMGRSGKKCARERFDRRILNTRYQRLLENVAGGSSDVHDF